MKDVLPATTPALRLVPVAFGDPDAARLMAQVQQVYVERYGSPDETPLDPAMFDPPSGRFFVGYVGAEAVATGAWRRHTDLTVLGTTRVAEIKRMYVVAAAQRRGHARTMLAHLERTAAAAGFEALVLETGTMQPEAIALYTAAGYEPIPGFGHYRDAHDARSFARLLDPVG